MQSQLVDKKLSIIYDRYKDMDFAANAQKEVEVIRNKAVYVGAGATASILALNELVRLTKRSRKLNSSKKD